ncbi:MAG TPA: ATP-binding cassette domain-containing protein [Spirochaetia bacterium]|nr:ATP-binding cassette domain-containing protein [Spirochaetia bacterium]
MNGVGIELDKVDVIHGEKLVLEQVTLTFPPGETTVMLGPSGSGKSVLLKVAGGLILPDRGRVYLDGKNLHAMSERENQSFRRSNGFVFQDAALWANSTLFQNMSLPLRFHYPAMSEEEIANRIKRILDRIGFKENLSMRPADSSGGERKIVSFVRALVAEPQYIFMDEPLGEIDHQIGEQMLELIREQKRAGKTIIIVTHDPMLTSQLADSLVVLQNGRVIEHGPLSAVVRSTNPAVEAILTRVLSEASTFDGSILDILDSGAEM